MYSEIIAHSTGIFFPKKEMALGKLIPRATPTCNYWFVQNRRMFQLVKPWVYPRLNAFSTVGTVTSDALTPSITTWLRAARS